MKRNAPIGVFDSGYGGLTVFKELVKTLPEYDFLYLGDNARNPYGTRSFQVVYHYTLEAVKYLFQQNCQLIIIACNTASAKALRNIQQIDLPRLAPEKRVLGVIRPSVERVSEVTKNGHVGVLATTGTVISQSYPIELEKWSGGRVVSTVQEACPMWVPIVENNEIFSEGAEYFIRKNIQNILKKDKNLDTLILGCTHYPLLYPVIQKFIPPEINMVQQGEIVADKLLDYLKRHPEIDSRLSKNSQCIFQTTESSGNFENNASLFLSEKIEAKTVHL